MRIKTANMEIEADSLDDIRALIAIVSGLNATRPLASAGEGNREAELRESYRAKYGKGFTMKGRAGSALAILEAMEAAGWEAEAPGETEAAGMEGPPAESVDDGESFV